VARTLDSARLEGLDRGRIEAAAGCGKTEAIVQLTQAWTGRRTLILTHTLAGVSALRRRLRGANVSSHRYSLSSIDSWCVNRVGEFPQRAGPFPDANDPDVFYPQIHDGCIRLLEGHALDSSLRATYGRVLVDEYQDCSPAQHAIVSQLAQLLPTFVFGDRLQAIFNFRNARVVDWDGEVIPTFPLLETLDHPWRWERVGAVELGNWLIAARAQLLKGTGVDLMQLPPGCEWRRLSGVPNQDQAIVLRAAGYWQREAASVLLLANPGNPTRHAKLARSAGGVQVVENLDLLSDFANVARLDAAAENERLPALLALAQSVMTGMGASMLQRCESLRTGRARTEATPEEAAALAFERAPDWRNARNTLRAWSALPGRRVFRREVFSMLLDALAAASGPRQRTLSEAMGAARERRRHQGRLVPSRSIGSTLLLKGLEADYTVLVDVEGLSPAHVYVALTRGTRGMLICSRQRWIGQAR
jgi:hypothetical protein